MILWILSRIITALGALPGLAALGSVYVFWRKRQTIPYLTEIIIKKKQQTILSQHLFYFYQGLSLP
jgi:hypothetical protein